MKERKATLIKMTADKAKHDFINTRIEITASNESGKKLENQLFRFIQSQLNEFRNKQ